MIVIERSTFRDESGAISLENRLRGTLRFGLRWHGEMEAQLAVTQRLLKSLGDEHVLVRNQPIPGTDVIIPLILLSPQGVRVLVPTPIRGIYRAKLDEWLTFDGGARRFKRVRPNLQGIALMMANQLLRFLKGQGYPLPEIESVLIFTNPRTHVDTARPSVRIVLADAIDHFASNLQKFPAIMDGEDIGAVLESLTSPRPASPVAEPEAPASAERIEAAAQRQAEARADLEAARAQRAPTPEELAEIGEEESWAAGPSGAAPRLRPGALHVGRRAPSPAASASQAAEAFVEAPVAAAAPEPLKRPAPRQKQGGLTRRQWVILLAMLVLGELIILAGFGYIFLYGSPFG
jgi:hypothetical protein